MTSASTNFTGIVINTSTGFTGIMTNTSSDFPDDNTLSTDYRGSADIISDTNWNEVQGTNLTDPSTVVTLGCVSRPLSGDHGLIGLPGIDPGVLSGDHVGWENGSDWSSDEGCSANHIQAVITTARNYWALILVLFPLWTVFGNVLVCLSVHRERSLRTVTNYFIVSLAIADIMVAILVMPAAVLVEIFGGEWIFGDALCDAWVASDVMCCTASILNLTAISVDRFIAVTRPLRYAKHSSSERVYLMLALTWIISVVISSPIALGFNYSQRRAETPTLCTFYNSNFLIFSSMGSFYIPGVLMILLYWRIFRAIHLRAHRNLSRNNLNSSLRPIKGARTEVTGSTARGAAPLIPPPPPPVIMTLTSRALPMKVTPCPQMSDPSGPQRNVHYMTSSNNDFSTTDLAPHDVINNDGDFHVTTSQEVTIRPHSVDVFTLSGRRVCSSTMTSKTSLVSPSSAFTSSLATPTSAISLLMSPSTTFSPLTPSSLPILSTVSGVPHTANTSDCTSGLHLSLTLRQLSVNIIAEKSADGDTDAVDEDDEDDPWCLQVNNTAPPTKRPKTTNSTFNAPPAQRSNVCQFDLVTDLLRPAVQRHSSGSRSRHHNDDDDADNAGACRPSQKNCAPNHQGQILETGNDIARRKWNGFQDSDWPEPEGKGYVAVDDAPTVNLELSLASLMTSQPRGRSLRKSVTAVAAATVMTSQIGRARGRGLRTSITASANAALKRQKEKCATRRERKATKTLAIVLGVFLLCWMPFFTINIINAVCIRYDVKSNNRPDVMSNNSSTSPPVTTGLCVLDPSLFSFFVWLGYMNSFLNPVIYTIFNVEFRRAFNKILHKGLCLW